MTSSLAATVAQFNMQTRLYLNALEGISDTEANTRNSDQVNHIKWIAGHVLNTRLNFLSKIAGLPHDESYVAQFGRGSTLDLNAEYPALEELKAKWHDSASAISAGLAAIPEEVLAAEAPSKTPIGDDSIRGLIAFLVSHEAYHIGQLSILRKMNGKEAMSY